MATNSRQTSAQDYYPFGSLEPDRAYSSENYRFGFNGQEMNNESAVLHRFMSRISHRLPSGPRQVSFLMKRNRIILLAFFCLFFSNVNIAQTFDLADSSDYQLKVVKEFNDTIKCYGTSQYADSCFFKDGIWLIYSKDDTTKILEIVSIFNKNRMVYPKFIFLKIAIF